MRKAILLCAALLAATTTSFAQINQAFKINYFIRVDQEDSQATAEEPISLYEAYVTKEKIKVVSTTDGLESIFLANKDDRYGYLDGQGKIGIPFIYSGATSFSDGLAAVTRAGSDDVILINTKGEEVEVDAAAAAEVVEEN